MNWLKAQWQNLTLFERIAFILACGLLLESLVEVSL